MVIRYAFGNPPDSISPEHAVESWWRVLLRRLFERRAQRSVGMLILVLLTALAIFGFLADAF
jgi:hypothetical protein